MSGGEWQGPRDKAPESDTRPLDQRQGPWTKDSILDRPRGGIIRSSGPEISPLEQGWGVLGEWMLGEGMLGLSSEGKGGWGKGGGILRGVPGTASLSGFSCRGFDRRGLPSAAVSIATVSFDIAAVSAGRGHRTSGSGRVG